MTDILLGLIALGTLITALLQIFVIVALLRMGKRIIDRAERLKAMIDPLPAHVTSIQDDVERMRTVAERQLVRVSAIYEALEPTVRHGMTALAVMRGVTAFWKRRR